MTTIPSLDNLTKMLTRLPSIGERSALRLAMHLFYSDSEFVSELSLSLATLHQNVKTCKVCFALSDDDLCSICSSDNRDKGLICVVEGYTDLLAIERTNEYRGVFHVLNGLISPFKGVGVSDLNIASLFERLKEYSAHEIIIAFSASLEADTTASYLHKAIQKQGFDIKISRITYGISMGSDIENADPRSLARSMLDRQEYQ